MYVPLFFDVDKLCFFVSTRFLQDYFPCRVFLPFQLGVVVLMVPRTDNATLKDVIQVGPTPCG